MEEPNHYFTGHTNARLTFVIGVVIGISIITAVGSLFFVYLFNGGQIGNYAIAPLDTSTQILTEPVTAVSTIDANSIVEPQEFQIYGVTENYAVTLVQYVDYECRFCKKFFPDVLTLVDQHPDKIRLIIKQYPLVQIHPYAKAAALAAYCAGQQNRLVEYSSRLFAVQNDLSDESVFTTIADTLQLDAPAFATCRQQTDSTTAITEDTAEALELGIQSQPNLLIWHNDGSMQFIDGYVNIHYLESLLQADLNE